MKYIEIYWNIWNDEMQKDEIHLNDKIYEMMKYMKWWNIWNDEMPNDKIDEKPEFRWWTSSFQKKKEKMNRNSTRIQMENKRRCLDENDDHFH